jgi:prepilin peptidase CpaA
MSIPTLQIVMVSAHACGLLYAAITDIKARIIPNPLVIAIALAAPLYWWATGLSLWPDIAWQLGMAIIVFGVGAGLFALGQMGGGDVKLLAALALWFPPMPMVSLLFAMAIIGGLLTVFMLIRHRLQKAEGVPEIPYGVAIALAGLWMLYERNLNHFA